MQSKRIWQVDALRGLALLHMLAYHALYDWVYLFGHDVPWYDIYAPGCHVWQQYICWSFILLSGYCAATARSLLRNGLVVAGCAAVLTVVTAVAMPSEAIWWGVLHLNASAVLLAWVLRPVWQRLPAAVALAGCAAGFLLTNALPWGYLGFEGLRLVRLPAAWYHPNLFWLGLPDLGRFASADYFPLLPWVFLFGVGLFAARLWRPAPAQPPRVLRPLCAVGGRTLFVYMLHQPVLYAVLWAADALLRAAAG